MTIYTVYFTPSKADAIILFSGGLDSYAGVKILESQYNQLLGIFVAHNDQPRIIKIVDNIKPLLNTEVKTIYAPSMGATGYSQLRGFLYILTGAIFLNLCGTNKLLVTECGPTMYQPMFSPYDSITYTTHPYVLKAAKDTLEILLGRTPEIIIPFEDLTKAEIVKNSNIKDFSKTHSCISQRFGNHDGTCFGCVIKNLACLVAGVKDVKYNNDVFQEGANQDNLLNLLNFSYDILNDYNNTPNFQTDKIEEFGKQDLFIRYALDNLTGVMLGTNKKHELYKKFVIPNESLIKARIKEISRNLKKPNFNKYVL